MKVFKNTEEKIKFLKECAKLYEANGTSPLTDDEYDDLYREAKKEEPYNPFFSEVGGEIDDTHIYGTRVVHKYIMGSLSKDSSPEEFGEWFGKTYGQDIDKLVALIQLKVDGCSFCLKYQDGKLIQGVSRGDGISGIDYTNNARYIRGVEETISVKEYVEIKGEIYKDLKDFKRDFEGKGFAGNARNFASGSINQKDPLETKKRGLNFIAYEVRGVDFATEIEKIKFLVDNGFNTLKTYTSKIECKGRKVEDIVRAIKNYMNKVDRINLPFLIDGIVFKNNDIKWGESLGTTDGGKRPKSSRAVKFPAEQKLTTLKSVIAQVGRTGTIKPVGIVDAIDLSGATIQRVSLHNYGALIKTNSIKIGSKVEVAKRGDIIPQIIKVISIGNISVDIPTVCPECKSVLEWTTNTKGEKVDLYCNNTECIAQLNKKIDFFFKTIGVKGFGEGTIKVLTDQDELEWDGKPIISSLVEMFYMLDNDRKTEHPFRKYAYLKANMGEKTYENLLESIKSVKEVSLPIFIESLGIGRIGSMSKDICDVAPTVEDIDKLTEQDISSIQGFGPIKAKNFVEEWHERKDEIRRLLKYISIKQVAQTSDKLNGKKFCFTGSFSKSRDEYQKMVGENGGKNAGSVGKDVILVWDGEEQGNKYNKAVKEGNKIISEADFLKMFE